MNVEVKIIDLKTFGLYIDDVLLGTSKLHCDAMLAKHTLDAALAAQPQVKIEESDNVACDTTEETPYFVEVEDNGCSKCGAKEQRLL